MHLVSLRGCVPMTAMQTVRMMKVGMRVVINARRDEQSLIPETSVRKKHNSLGIIT